MALNVPSFFAGIGTVLALLILGFGGGVLMSGVISDSPRERGKVEKWAAEAQKAPVVAATPVPAPPPVTSATPVPVPAPVATATSTQSDIRKDSAAEPQASVPSAPPPQQQPAAVSSPVSSPPASSSQTSSSPPSSPAPQASPLLGQERPAALVNPAAAAPAAAAPDLQLKSEKVRRAEEKVRRAEEKARRAEFEQRNEQRRKQLAERRRQQFEHLPETRSAVGRSRPQELDDDDGGRRAEFPFFRGRERDDFRRPSVRLFGGDDD